MQFLSDQEKVLLKMQHKKERDRRVCDRIKAILLFDKGWTPQQVAEALLISDQTVREYIEAYKASNKLRPESGGSIEKLSKGQSEQLEAHLQEHTYLYVRDMIAYVKMEFGVKYTIPGLRNWLQRHGFSYKKPSIVPGKANKEQQEKWLKEYEKLKAKLPAGETICFIDGVHPTHKCATRLWMDQKGSKTQRDPSKYRPCTNQSFWSN